MDGAWSEFVADPRVARHAVQIYGEPSELGDAVADYLVAGFEAGEPAVVVANHRHWGLFTDSLDRRGWGLDRIRADGGLLVAADAHATLAALMANGSPSHERFAEVVGALLDRAADRFPGRRLRVFGEMVDILAAQGQLEAATELERLWNELLDTREFSLLCGYRVDVFDRDAQTSTLPHVCDAHAHVRTAADPERFGRAVDGALADVLGPVQAGRVYALAADPARDERLPLAQLVLMWISVEMPALAERVLASARTRYVEASA